MNLLVVGLLVGLWVWVLMPGLLRERSRADERSARAGSAPPVPSGPVEPPDVDAPVIGREILVPADPERIVSARVRTAAELRRRAVLARGAMLLVVTGGLFVWQGGWWSVPLAVVAPPYVLYVAAVVRLERRLAERRDMLHDLDEERRRRQPATVEAGGVDDGLADDRLELVVGDETGIIVTGLARERWTTGP